jgi:putative endonuclease
MSRRNKNIGDWGEDQACIFLRRHRFEIVGRNFYTATGEIDIIARKGGDYYFIEVKTRMQNELANDSSITYIKKERLNKAVKTYCYKNNIGGCSIILAGLIIAVDKVQKKVNFRFCAFC